MIAPSRSLVLADTPVTAQRDWRLRLVTAAAWSVFAGFHALAAAFFGASAYSYWLLHDSGTVRFLESFRIGMHSRHYRVITIAYGIVAGINLVLLLEMVALSVRHQRFIFTHKVHIEPAKKGRNVARMAVRALLLVYKAIFSPTGLLGVNGPCFDLVLLAREVLETALQTVQAYRMSQHLARAWLTRFYVSLLVLNCWLLAMVHAFPHRSPTTRYFATILCDLVLDVVTSIVVPVSLVMVYARDADFKATNIFGLKWFEDVWQTNAANEFQLILVVSWADLASRLVFALGMVGALNTLKRFLGQATDRASKHEHGWRQRWNSIVPTTSNHQDDRSSRALQVLARANCAVKRGPLTKLQRVTFAVWGAVVLALQLSSEMARDVPECVMQVRPWGMMRPSCILALVNCHQVGIAGNATEVDECLAALHPPSMTKLLIRHCSSFEMPPIIQSFSNLAILKVYNSSITKWEQDSALTKTSHPSFSILMLVRVRVPGGQIPLGLQADDFPPTLNIFGFLTTNIRSIPDSLASKWPPGAVVHFDSAQLTDVPSALLRLKLRALELAGNPIDAVPEELFQVEGTGYLGLSDTNISALPGNVTPSSTLTSFNLDGTRISAFPAWVDEWLTFPGDGLYPERISASGSPYCMERDRVFSGELAAFSSPTDSRLMDASRGNWDYLKRKVSCSPTTMYRYPAWLEDMFGALQ